MHASTPMALYTVYIPLTDHEGQPVAPASLQWTVNKIARFTGGCTLLPPGDGFWITNRQSYYDQVVPIQSVAPVNAATATFFHGLADELAILLAQREIFIHCTSVMTLAPQPAWDTIEITL